MLRLLERAPSLQVIAPIGATRRSQIRRPGPGPRSASPATIPIEGTQAPGRVLFREILAPPWQEATGTPPSVVVTTHAWPSGWPMPRSATERAMARPIPIVPARPDGGDDPGLLRTPAPAGLHERDGRTQAERAAGAPAGRPATPASHRRALGDPAARGRTGRRGLLARAVMIAAGLIVSLIAVEAASRVARR
jgi:hypothetical protein